MTNFAVRVPVPAIVAFVPAVDLLLIPRTAELLDDHPENCQVPESHAVIGRLVPFV